jgi:hypothetical protein
MPRTAQSAVIDTSPVSQAEAAAIERAEALAWADLYAAAPEDWAERVGLGTRWLGGALVLSWAATGRRYFSRTLGLGVAEPATAEALDEILAAWDEAGIEMFLVQSQPHCRPEEYEDLLRGRGLEPFDRQDRIVRGAEPAVSYESDLTVEPVELAAADEWADFLQHVYHLDTGPWLQRLVGRAGWYPYVARRDGEVVQARTMHITPERAAWLGMDGPVPGLMTDDYEPDAALCARIVEDGLALGATSFLADIEAPSDAMDTPAYRDFARLGFRRPYTRTHWTGPASGRRQAG